MLRCLIRFRSAVMSSSRLIVRRSITLATISAYGRTREFAKVDSSRSNSSHGNAASSGEAVFSRGDSPVV